MNASPQRNRRTFILVAIVGLVVVIGFASALRGKRRVITTTYSHLHGGVVWQRVDYFESYYRPFPLRGLVLGAEHAVATRSWPRWRSRVESRYVLLEPVSGAPPKVLASMASFMARSFAAGIDGSGRTDHSTVNDLVGAASAQLEVRRKGAPNQDEYRDFRTMKVLHESPQYIVLQVSFEREAAALVVMGGNFVPSVTSASSSLVCEKQTGRCAPFPEDWNPATGQPIAEILDRFNQDSVQPKSNRLE